MNNNIYIVDFEDFFKLASGNVLHTTGNYEMYHIKLTICFVKNSILYYHSINTKYNNTGISGYGSAHQLEVNVRIDELNKVLRKIGFNTIKSIFKIEQNICNIKDFEISWIEEILKKLILKHKLDVVITS